MIKKILAVILILSIGYGAQAQKFFSRLPKPTTLMDTLYESPITGRIIRLKATLLMDSTFTGFRPVVIAAAYQEPNNVLMAGTGLSYQHDTYNASTQTWYVNWSVNALGFAGGSVAPNTVASIMSVGVGIGILNNVIIIGPCYNFTNKFGVFASIGINFNN